MLSFIIASQTSLSLSYRNIQEVSWVPFPVVRLPSEETPLPTSPGYPADDMPHRCFSERIEIRWPPVMYEMRHDRKPTVRNTRRPASWRSTISNTTSSIMKCAQFSTEFFAAAHMSSDSHFCYVSHCTCHIARVTACPKSLCHCLSLNMPHIGKCFV